MKRPNILFLFTDDQRRGTIHALGNEVISTPAMDSLVQNGTAFTNAYIMGGTHAAVCMPSRAMLMTGRSLFRIQGQGECIPAEQKTFPETFREAGYHTHHVGKWHQDRESFNRSFVSGDRIFGFTHGWYKDYGGHWNVAVHDYDPSGKYPHETGYMLAADKRTKVPIGPGAGGVHSSELFANAAVDFLDGYDKDDPFLLYVSFVAPHDPREAPNEFEEMYGPGNVAVPENFLPNHPFDNGELRVRDEALEAWPRRERAVQDHLSDYYAIISHADAQIGRILTALERNGLTDETLIVFSGDNGLAVGQHGLMGKQNLYEHSIGVPLIFSGLGLPRGQKTDAFCYLFDIFPTLCGAAGVDLPKSVEGKSLLPIIEGASNTVRDTMTFGYRKYQRALRQGPRKLIEYAVEGERYTQLFDVEKDPLEMENLARYEDESPDTGRILKEMRELLLNQLSEYDDPFRDSFTGKGKAVGQIRSR
ncbi:MAG: sulfatase-like hydrolase/transferase [Spirochaetia bacterium]